jgi:hypothetical protein
MRPAGCCRAQTRAIAVLLALVTGGAASGCGFPGTPGTTTTAAPVEVVTSSGGWTTRTLEGGQLALSVPSTWYTGSAWTEASSFSDLLGSYSNQALSVPCKVSGSSTTCGPPLTSLASGAVLVEVYHNAAPTWNIASQPGTPVAVSGFAARVTTEAGSAGVCTGLGADLTRDEVIAFTSTPDNYFEVTICSRGVVGTVGDRVLASIRVNLTA